MLSSMPMLGGVRLTPLPKSVLPSALDVYIPVEDEHGGTFSGPQRITNVRFDRATDHRAVSSAGAQGGYLYADDITGTVYIDAANSTGAFEVPERARVSIDGGALMDVVHVETCAHFDGTVHHWEVKVK
ncbi:MAG: hypothetical protein IJI68_09915 [Eggerthellaceae bacterium]|nr:hypothetical protein [Eggerthellaceae bacterium]